MENELKKDFTRRLSQCNSGEMIVIIYYMFCKNELSRAMYENRLDGVQEAEHIMHRLYTSFVEVAKQDKSAPLMKNTQQVYAGMTYARGAVNEDYMDVDSHRGFFV